ncbi:FAS1-like dehydratase domain-containing protein [Mycoplana rhizolycopersici]|uniref:MaoC family dehydratase N-terminal domain-containing protein n=1 Tax=Mycoplana rhizolycopersici TaxID=2746702 RepID=A0ABX2QE02_9HYPH|nr:MaoC family dehydratase N-terminal domain-containing protein [Rhizobium rhizolycopersici]NVP55408.1 MaoC family dehydratase N-terminal domain-containing protein [Rhizobium rhizolycopersici]
MSSEVSPDGRDAIGRTDSRRAVIAADRVAALAAALDLDGVPGGGAVLPPAWHWMFFNPVARRRELGPDGHPRRGTFLPDLGLPRRMWAGGRLTYHAPLPVGAEARRESEILDVVSKTGRSGRLGFVTVRHRISSGATLCIEEEQDLVFREGAVPGAPGAAPVSAPGDARWSEPFTPDPVLLFRYSALTENGHRIHYDQSYARAVEGYRDLVVHGPLIATLLLGLAARCRPGALLRSFSFRATAPLFVDRPFHLEAAPSEGVLSLWARGPESELAMQAEARFDD